MPWPFSTVYQTTENDQPKNRKSHRQSGKGPRAFRLPDLPQTLPLPGGTKVPRPVTGKGEKKSVSTPIRVKVEEDILKQVDRIAKKSGISRPDLIGRVLSCFCKKASMDNQFVIDVVFQCETGDKLE